MSAIRFWHFSTAGEAIMIRLKAGQVLRHYTACNTDEGWSSEKNEWEFDGRTIVNRWVSDGRDCDGRLTRHGESYCSADKVRAGYVDEDGITFPAWEQGASGQRDYSAEAMNY